MSALREAQAQALDEIEAWARETKHANRWRGGESDVYAQRARLEAAAAVLGILGRTIWADVVAVAEEFPPMPTYTTHGARRSSDG